MNMIVSAATLSTAAKISSVEAAPVRPADQEIFDLEAEYHIHNDAIEAIDPEASRLHNLRHDRVGMMMAARNAGEIDLTNEQIFEAVFALPESEECERLLAEMQPHYDVMDASGERMLSIAAQTAEGRAAQVMMLISHFMPAEWREPDEHADHEVRLCRNLMFALVGGQAGTDLRNQFA